MIRRRKFLFSSSKIFSFQISLHLKLSFHRIFLFGKKKIAVIFYFYCIVGSTKIIRYWKKTPRPWYHKIETTYILYYPMVFISNFPLLRTYEIVLPVHKVYQIHLYREYRIIHFSLQGWFLTPQVQRGQTTISKMVTWVAECLAGSSTTSFQAGHESIGRQSHGE